MKNSWINALVVRQLTTSELNGLCNKLAFVLKLLIYAVKNGWVIDSERENNQGAGNKRFR
jgi:hypothetical protein